MKKSNSLWAMFSAAAVLITVAAWLTVAANPAWAAGEPIVVIVNSANPVDSLSLADLKKLFLSDRSHWDTGKSVTLVMLAAGSPERAAFLKAVCGMSDADFSKYFLQAAFTGKAVTPPKEVVGAQSVTSVVAGSPGAIGFVRASDFPPSNGGIKPVKIDGRSAADPAYKLRM